MNHEPTMDEDLPIDPELLADYAQSLGSSSLTPTPRVRSRLLGRISRTPSEAGEAIAPGVRIVRAGGEDWEATSVPGVRRRRLAIDPDLRTETVLVKLDPGARYPEHHHEGLETCYVIEGDLQLEGQALQAGDFQSADVGSTHGEQWSIDGCVLLVTAPLDDGEFS